MSEYKFTMPDGSVFNATADSWEEAHKGIQDHIKQEQIDAANKAYTDAPVTSKARMIVGDPLNQIVHGLTAGLFDKGFDTATGANTAGETEAGAARMGPVATGIARAGGAMMLPSGAPGAVRAVGGGPLIRGGTGLGVAGLEGAAYGGVNAATSGDSIPAGILAGGVGGVAGQGVAQGIAAGTNRAFKSWQGINDAAPPRNITTLPKGKTPSARDLVDVAAAQAASTGAMKGSPEATQAAQRGNFEDLLTGKYKGTFTTRQQERMGEIAYGDPGTRMAEKAGDVLKNPFLAGALGLGAGYGTGGPIGGLMALGASTGSGKLLTRDSAKATQEAVDRLRAMIYKKKPFAGPLTAERTRKLGQGLGYDAMSGLEDYLQ